MSKSIVFVLFLIASSKIFGQGVYAPMHNDYNHLVQRYEITSGENAHNLHTSFQPYNRRLLASSLDSFSKSKESRDEFNYNYLIDDNHEWIHHDSANSDKTVLKYFYTKKNAAYFYGDEFFEVQANPVMHFSVGNDSEKSDPLFFNSRGAEIRGMIDKKVGFYSYISENQVRLPSYVDERIAEDGVIPHEGFRKGFGVGAYDFFTARGYFTFNPTKHIGLQFGNDRNFIGNGYRSMILSDYAAPYLFLKAETQVWRIKYTNLFTQMTANRNRTSSSFDGLYLKKYVALHHLSINIGKNLNIGLFESVIFGRQNNNDSLQSAGFELAYLNPIIFYRAVEQNLGSPDNAIVGTDWRWNFLKKFSLYGQFVLDEIIVDNLRSGNGWWGNKFGFQSGLKYINAFGIKNLDVQLELNLARPYTYTHISDFSNYQHFQQPLAHPLGANFVERLAIIRYQPTNRLTAYLKIFSINMGVDPNNSTYVGQDIRVSYDQRFKDFGNTIAQGQNENILLNDLRVSYMIKHNVFVDLQWIFRKRISENSERNSESHVLGFGFRWNALTRLYEF